MNNTPHPAAFTDPNAFYVQPQMPDGSGMYTQPGMISPDYGMAHGQPQISYGYEHGMQPAEPRLTPIAAEIPPPSRRDGRIKWGRMLVLVIGVAVVGFAVVNLTSSARSDAAKARAKAKQAGIAKVAGSQAQTAAGAAIDPATTPGGGAAGAIGVMPPPPTSAQPTVAKLPAPVKARAAAKQTGANGPSHSTRAPGAGYRPSTPKRSSGNHPAAITGSHGGAAAAIGGGGAGRSAVRAGGRGAAGQPLPYTGASTWIAALLGVTLLAAGVFIQYKALAIGETAAMYRRGPLLRPFWLIALTIRNVPHATAYVARATPGIKRGLARLQELLDERGDDSEFVSARRVAR